MQKKHEPAVQFTFLRHHGISETLGKKQGNKSVTLIFRRINNRLIVEGGRKAEKLWINK